MDRRSFFGAVFGWVGGAIVGDRPKRGGCVRTLGRAETWTHSGQRVQRIKPGSIRRIPVGQELVSAAAAINEYAAAAAKKAGS